MKRTIIALTALILCLLPFTAASGEEKLFLAYAQDPLDGGSPTRSYYNANGTLARREAEDGLVWRYTYRKDGTLERVTQGVPGIQDEMVKEYDGKGNLTCEYILDKNGRTDVTYCRNAYDDRGRLIEAQTQSADEDYPMGTTTAYTYWDDGTWEVSESDYMVYQQQRIPHCQKTTTYSAEGLVIMEELTMCDMAAMDSVSIYEYDTRGQLTAKFSNWRESDGAYQSENRHYTNSYDASGKLTSTKVWLVNPATGKRTLEKTITCTYTPEGRIARRVTRSEDDGYETEDLWEYDTAGNVTSFQGWVYLSGGIGKGSWEQVEQSYRYLPLKEVLWK